MVAGVVGDDGVAATGRCVAEPVGRGLEVEGHDLGAASGDLGLAVGGAEGVRSVEAERCARRGARDRECPAGAKGAAPSFSPPALPAVTVASRPMIGRDVASVSTVEVGRTCSSRSTTVLPFRSATDTGTISSAKRPSSVAATAR